MERNEAERCGFLFVHDDVVKKVMAEMPEESVLYDLAELFKILAIRRASGSSMRCSKPNFACAILRSSFLCRKRRFPINCAF